MKILRTVFYMLAVLTGLCVLVLYLRSDVDPKTWSPAPLPAMAGEFAPSPGYSFANGQLFNVPAHGPEDVAMDSHGHFYTGLSDGHIVRFSVNNDGTSSEPEFIVDTGGRPLGMQFDPQNNLIVADAVKGLLTIAPNGKIEVLVNHINGKPMRLVDDLDIASDGTIWFTDASQRFGLDEFMKDFLEASFTGRLLSYTPANQTTRVHMEGLFFANGVALGPNENYVLVSETGTGRIHRLWLKTDKAGQQDVFYDGLPGNPDNLSFNGRDIFWVAVPDLRDKARENTANALFVRTLIGGLPPEALNVSSTVALVIGLGIDGNIKHVLFEDPAAITSITSVNQYGDRLYLGNLTSRQVLSIPVPANPVK